VFAEADRQIMSSKFNVLPSSWPMLIGLLLGVTYSALLSTETASKPSPSHIIDVLNDAGLYVDSSELFFINPSSKPSQTTWQAVFLGHQKGELADVYRATFKQSSFSPQALMLSLANLTRTSSAEECGLKVVGHHAAYATRLGAVFDAIALVDLKSQPTELTRSWSSVTRLQDAVSNLQLTGSTSGIGLWRYRLSEPASELQISVRGQQFEFAMDSHRHIWVDPQKPDRVAIKNLEIERPQKGQPGKLGWLVDTARRVPWIGQERIAWLEHHVFSTLDWVERIYYRLLQNDKSQKPLEEIVRTKAPSRRGFNVQDAQSGWPPAHIPPLLTDAVDGEGQWVAVQKDAFVRTYPNASAAFYQTFLRADPERTFAPIYLTVWDPRQVQLHIVMGTQEPESATGETGAGSIPRDPQTMQRLVGAFNGGFQALHGEFGMMAEGRVYLPPKPWAATVAVFDDDSVGLGSWPAPPQGVRGYAEDWAIEQIPPGMIAMRQNLTSLVEDGIYNPWGRWWWGAAPLYAKEQTYTHRTALCLTTEGFMIYFWGTSMGPEALGRVMAAAHCARGMHLDMNHGHCGFEFYHVTKPAESLEPINRRLSEWEAEGQIPVGSERYSYRVRKAIKSMSNMRFPRYITKDPRDFFYLTLKPILPGPDIALQNGKTIQFSTQGLPHVGWPYPFARAELKHNAQTVSLLRIDLRRVLPDDGDDSSSGAELATLERFEDSGADIALAIQKNKPSTLRMVPLPLSADMQLIAQGRKLNTVRAASAALGIDREGFLVYAETTQTDASELSQAMAIAGVPEALALPDNGRLVLRFANHDVRIDGTEHTIKRGVPVVRWRAHSRPAAHVIFPDTKPRPYSVWGHLQGQRVRYVPKNAPRFRGPLK